MIWTIRDESDQIYFYTSDSKKFKKMKDATEYVASNFDNLNEKNYNFNLHYVRRKKLGIILSKINQQYN